MYIPVAAGHKNFVPSITNIIPYVSLAGVDLLDDGM